MFDVICGDVKELPLKAKVNTLHVCIGEVEIASSSG
jgi:hypothetical protein